MVAADLVVVDVQEEVVGAPAAEGHKDIFQQNKMPLLELRIFTKPIILAVKQFEH